MRLAVNVLKNIDQVVGAVKSNNRIVLQGMDGKDVAAIIPIEDLYLLERLEECMTLRKPASRLPVYAQGHVSP